MEIKVLIYNDLIKVNDNLTAAVLEFAPETDS